MSSSLPVAAAENDEVVETVEGGTRRPPSVMATAGTAVQGGAVANNTALSPREEANNGDEDADMDEEYEDTASADLDFDDDMDDDFSGILVDFDEEGGQFSESVEVEATLEALWRKVGAIEEKPSAGHTCSVCMEHLTCEGAHRICCIPCGHVYGRLCLERWLQCDGNETARCPQCSAVFAENHIVNLYAPGNLWDGCGRVQEVKVYVTKAMAELVVECERKMKATRALASSKIAKCKADQRSSIQEVYAKVREMVDLMEKRIEAEVDKTFARMVAKLRSLPPPNPAELQEEEPGTGSG